jgi:hypothetical protein
MAKQIILERLRDVENENEPEMSELSRPHQIKGIRNLTFPFFL